MVLVFGMYGVIDRLGEGLIERELGGLWDFV